MATKRVSSDYIRWFDEIGIDDIPSVGGKNASLGEMYRELAPKGVKVPNGFAVTAGAYRYFLRYSGLEKRLRDILEGLDTRDMDNLRSRGSQALAALLDAELPDDLEQAILEAYQRLGESSPRPLDVAVRSSATAEDLPDASFAGQQETYLNVQGGQLLLETCKRCFASLYTDRAISYRVDKNFEHFKVGLSIGVQQMVRSDLAASGVMFSIDTETGFRDAVLINASYGLGENVVQGTVNPDEYDVFKPTLKTGALADPSKTDGYEGVQADLRHRRRQDDPKRSGSAGGPRPFRHRRRRDPHAGALGLRDRGPLQHQARPSRSDGHGMGQGRKHRRALHRSGASGDRAVSEAGRFDPDLHAAGQRSRSRSPGRSVGEKIGRGPVRVVKRVQDLHQFQQGDVLVTDKTDPDWEPTMKKAAAIVTNRGGRTCHAAIVSRELGLPAIVGTERGTETLHDGQNVTVSLRRRGCRLRLRRLARFRRDPPGSEQLDAPRRPAS